ncbi:P protein-like isoform X1 [Cydia splendana]|uniref:P protein-like isoform X1 n=1 Tax=Cydia splendana TaxID=1100963 RepID=UPI00300C96F7
MNDGYLRKVKKFSGVFISLRKKTKKKVWNRRSLREYNLENESKEREPELTRSQYSLVSQDLTAGALQLWLGLPEEVKYDPALAAFRQFYEKETAQESLPLRPRRSSAPKVKRLPAVNSAPHLNNNERVSEDPHAQNGSVYFTQDYKPVEATEANNHLLHGQKKPSKWDKARSYTKLSLLVGCWVFFTVVFCLFNEKEVTVRNCVLTPGQVKDYILEVPKSHLTLLVDVSGPFLTQQEEQKLNHTVKDSRSKVDVWVERWAVREDTGDIKEMDIVERENFTQPHSFLFLDPNELEFSEATPRSAKFEHQSNLNSTAVYVIRMLSDSAVATPISLSYQDGPIDVAVGVTYACLLLVMLYALIIFEIINRTLAAILVSTLSLAVLSLAGERPSVEQLVSWLDVETLLLLLSMMLLVAIMAETGMFDFLAVFTFQVTKGKMWPLINVLCAITAVLSTFLDNVTTVLLITPVTIKLCEVMEMHPIPVLTAMVLYSNIGGTATPVGDPPNVIIASNQIVIQSGINFANFTLHMTLGIILVCVQTYLQLRFMYRDVSKLRPSEPRDIQDLRRQLNVWRRAADSLPHMSKDELVVKERLERKVLKITSQLAIALKESNKRACPKDTFQRTLSELKEKYKIRDKKLLIKSCVAIGFVVVMFFLHAFPEFNRVSLGWTALLGAILLLILADREDIESILHRVEWSTLLFFAALFVLMEALTKLGLIDYIGGLTEALIMRVHETHRLAVALLLILWISGVTSAFVDNIPLTTMMVRVVTSLGTNPALGLPLPPLIWALSFGACLGGNGTLIGASANVVCAGVAEQHGYKFTFVQFFKVGFPIMIGHLVVASGYLLVCHCLLTWH